MKVISLIVFRWFDDSKRRSIVLAQAYELSSFSFFKRSHVKEVALFVSREVVQRSKSGERQSVAHQGHVCHVFVHHLGVACAALTDADYPATLAHNLCGAAAERFLQEHGESFESYESDQDLKVSELEALLTRYQDPETADPIAKLKKDLEETKQILHKSIDQMLERDEKLETLAKKSYDLNLRSKAFLTETEKMNKCCSYM